MTQEKIYERAQPLYYTKGTISNILANKQKDKTNDETKEEKKENTISTTKNKTKNSNNENTNRKIGKEDTRKDPIKKVTTNKTIQAMRIQGGEGRKEIETENTTPTSNETGTKETKTKKIKIIQENLPFGHVCDDIAIDNDTPYVRVYCQNVCGIFDREGAGLDLAFKEIKQAGADIFTFNETHGDESNAIARRALRMSKQRMWKDNNENCTIVHSSSKAPVLNFTKPGGNLVGITGQLTGRIRGMITDPYGRWCGFTLIGRDTKEIMVLTAYNVSQHKNAKVGEDTLFNQQIALYKLYNIRDPDPKKMFIDDLTVIV
jgi:hypothetical protein